MGNRFYELVFGEMKVVLIKNQLEVVFLEATVSIFSVFSSKRSYALNMRRMADLTRPAYAHGTYVYSHSKDFSVKLTCGC